MLGPSTQFLPITLGIRDLATPAQPVLPPPVGRAVRPGDSPNQPCAMYLSYKPTTGAGEHTSSVTAQRRRPELHPLPL